MEWALHTAVSHPALKNSIVTANGDWLDILLNDGRTFRFRPGALINETSPLEIRTDLLNRLISIGVKNALAPSAEEAKINQPNSDTPDSGTLDSNAPNSNTSTSNTPDTPAPQNFAQQIQQIDSINSHTYTLPAEFPELINQEAHSMLPIVRNAAYFLNSHQGKDSLIYLPLTDFIATGIATSTKEELQPIYYSQIADDFRDISEILSESVITLRKIAANENDGLQLAVLNIAGAQVVSFTNPANIASSWFTDLEIIQQVVAQMQTLHKNSLPLFVPAALTKLYVVFDDDPQLISFFSELLATRDFENAIYPLPHTVAADGWCEWIPLPGSPLAQVLGALRGEFRKKIYDTQVEQMLKWGEFGALKEYEAKVLHNGERVSHTIWRDTDGFGSLPDTDFITFIREPSPHPWEKNRGIQFTIRSHIAREIWKDAFQPAKNTWPPRWQISGFPDEPTLTKLQAASSREF